MKTQLWIALFSMVLAVAVWLPAARGQAKKEEEKKIPPPENVEVTTRDKVILKCRYYPGANGKDSAAIIILHDADSESAGDGAGSKADMDGLATYLQSLGDAVICPDLRGFGESTTVEDGPEKIDWDRLRRSNKLYENMVWDIEAAKGFLMEENNRGQLNIETLCVIAVGMSTVPAANWVAYDWSHVQVPAFKKGQDVKALVLVSPQQSVQGYTSRLAFRTPFYQNEAINWHEKHVKSSLMFVVGQKDRSSYSEAMRIKGYVEKAHPTPEKEKARDDTTLFFLAPDTSLSGAKLLDPKLKELDVISKIGTFIELRLFNKKDEFSWNDRRNPFASQ